MKNYLTPAGAERLRAELKDLLYTQRPKLVETVAWAASNGDRSENGDYIYGKRKLREIDRRIHFLTKRLEIAEVIDPTQIKDNCVRFGATVTVLDEDENKVRFQIVGADETNPKQRRISWQSPIANALMQKKVGDLVTVKTPSGPVDYEIIALEYVEIP